MPRHRSDPEREPAPRRSRAARRGGGPEGRVEVRAHPEVVQTPRRPWDWVRAMEHRSEKEIVLTEVPDQPEDSVLRYPGGRPRGAPRGRRKRRAPRPAPGSGPRDPGGSSPPSPPGGAGPPPPRGGWPPRRGSRGDSPPSGSIRLPPEGLARTLFAPAAPSGPRRVSPGRAERPAPRRGASPDPAAAHAIISDRNNQATVRATRRRISATTRSAAPRSPSTTCSWSGAKKAVIGKPNVEGASVTGEVMAERAQGHRLPLQAPQEHPRQARPPSVLHPGQDHRDQTLSPGLPLRQTHTRSHGTQEGTGLDL